MIGNALAAGAMATTAAVPGCTSGQKSSDSFGV